MYGTRLNARGSSTSASRPVHGQKEGLEGKGDIIYVYYYMKVANTLYINFYPMKISKQLNSILMMKASGGCALLLADTRSLAGWLAA